MTDIKFQGFSFWRIYFLYVLKVEGGGCRRGKEEREGRLGREAVLSCIIKETKKLQNTSLIKTNFIDECLYFPIML